MNDGAKANIKVYVFKCSRFQRKGLFSLSQLGSLWLVPKAIQKGLLSPLRLSFSLTEIINAWSATQKSPPMGSLTKGQRQKPSTKQVHGKRF